VADRECISVHQDLLHQQSQNRLAIFDGHRVGIRAEACPEVAERLHQAQVFSFVGSHRFQRLQFRLDSLLLFAEFRHAAAQLIKAHQSVLIGGQQPVHVFRQTALVAA
jgi:hypothetical protein